jgi:hypothetical protein
MKKVNLAWFAPAIAFAMLVAPGCNDDDVSVPADPQAVEAALDDSLDSVVVPLVTFYGTIGAFLTAPAASENGGGSACPDTSGWCSSGTVDCTRTANGLAFDFDECQVVTGDAPLLVDGDIVAVPSGATVVLTLTNLFLNNSAAISGTGTIDVNACDYTVDVHTADASVTGLVTQCDDDDFPTGDVLNIDFDDFLVTVTFDGTNIATATATVGGTPVAQCTIDLSIEPLSSSCEEPS